MVWIVCCGNLAFESYACDKFAPTLLYEILGQLIKHFQDFGCGASILADVQFRPHIIKFFLNLEKNRMFFSELEEFRGDKNWTH